MQYCTNKRWYVLRVRSQAERLVHVGDCFCAADFKVGNAVFTASCLSF